MKITKKCIIIRGVKLKIKEKIYGYKNGSSCLHTNRKI